MTVLQVCAYEANYAGNFIASLEALERRLKELNIHTIYAFCAPAAEKDWCKQIQKRTRVYFLPLAKARILPHTYAMFRKIYRENDVDIVHSHFELYDIPATVTAPKDTKVFWHLHDPIDPGAGLRSLLWKLQYGIVGHRATLLAVAEKYRNKVISMGFPADQTHLVINSISLDRVSSGRTNEKKTYDFLTFGWDFYRKGDDLILEACDRLDRDGYQFTLLLNGNVHTWPVLQSHLAGRTPTYLHTGEPVEDINLLLHDADVFIQASRSETFSYAVCEAAYAGMPVISSDIPGLEWAHELPTVEFFPTEDAGQLYLLMKGWLDGAKKQDLSAAARSQQIIENRYSLHSWVCSIIRQYGIE